MELFGPAAASITSAYSVGISAMFPRFDWENPNQAVTFEGDLLIGLCSFGLFVLSVAAFFLGLFLAAPMPAWAAVAVVALLWMVCASLPAWAAVAAGRARLKRLEWEL